MGCGEALSHLVDSSSLLQVVIIRFNLFDDIVIALVLVQRLCSPSILFEGHLR